MWHVSIYIIIVVLYETVSGKYALTGISSSSSSSSEMDGSYGGKTSECSVTANKSMNRAFVI
jgi:hypothetical protein